MTEVSFRTKQPLWILFIAQFTLSYLKLCMTYFRSLTLPFVSKLRRRNIFRKWSTLNTDMTSRRNHYVTHENRLTSMLMTFPSTGRGSGNNFCDRSGCTVQLAFRGRRFDPKSSDLSFVDIWSSNNFYDHSLPTAGILSVSDESRGTSKPLRKSMDIFERKNSAYFPLCCILV